MKRREVVENRPARTAQEIKWSCHPGRLPISGQGHVVLLLVCLLVGKAVQESRYLVKRNMDQRRTAGMESAHKKRDSKQERK